MTHVLLVGFPMKYSQVHAIPICMLVKDHLYKSCDEGAQGEKVLINPCMFIKSRYINIEYLDNHLKSVHINYLIIPPELADIQQSA